MKIIIRTKGAVKMTDNVKEHIDEQVGTLDKMFVKSENVTANVLLSEKDNKFATEITIVLKHVVLRAECKGDTLYAAIDQAADKVEQQLIKHNKKVNAIIKKREGVSEYFQAIQNSDEPVEENKPMRVKEIELMEMSVDEAITEMELVDHNFYLFKNEANHRVAVVYKRENGGYGLLESLE